MKIKIKPEHLRGKKDFPKDDKLKNAITAFYSPPRRKRYIIFGNNSFETTSIKNMIAGMADDLPSCAQIMMECSRNMEYETYDTLDMDTGEWIDL